VGVAKNGSEFGSRDRANVGADFAALTIGAGAQEYNAGVGIGRTKGECDRLTGMDADSGEGGVITQGGLEGGLFARLHAYFHFVSSQRADFLEPPKCRSAPVICCFDPNPRCALQVAVSPDFGFPIRVMAVRDSYRPSAKSSLTRWTLAKAGTYTIHAFLPTVTFDTAIFGQDFATVSTTYSAAPKVNRNIRVP
jgi:hypothetical protein